MAGTASAVPALTPLLRIARAGGRGCCSAPPGGAMAAFRHFVEPSPPEQFLFKLVAVFDRLDRHEYRGADERHRDCNHRHPPLVALDISDRHGDRHAADQKNRSVGDSKLLIHELLAPGKERGVIGAEDRVSTEEATKEQNLGGEKEPHAEFASVVLLLHALEVMRKMRFVHLFVSWARTDDRHGDLPLTELLLDQHLISAPFRA